MQLGGQQRTVVGAELVGVQAQAETEGLGGTQHGARLLQGKHAGFAEDVAVFGEVLLGHARQHFVDHEIDVVVDAAAIFVGNLVGAQESGYVAQTRIGGELADGPEDFDFGVGREAVARLSFDGSGAASEKPLRVAAARGEQSLGGVLASEPDGGADPAAESRDLGVSGAFHAAFEFGGAVAGKDGMGVRVDEAGEYDVAAGVDDFGAGGEPSFDLNARAGGHEAPVAHVQSAVGDDGELPHGGPRARTGRPGEGYDLAAVYDGEVSHRGIRLRLVHPSAARTCVRILGLAISRDRKSTRLN